MSKLDNLVYEAQNSSDNSANIRNNLLCKEIHRLADAVLLYTGLQLRLKSYDPSIESDDFYYRWSDLMEVISYININLGGEFKE